MKVTTNLRDRISSGPVSIGLLTAVAAMAPLVSILTPSIGQAAGPAPRPAGELEPLKQSPYEIKTFMIGKRRYCYKDEGSGKAVVFVRAAYIPENQFDGQLAGLSMAGYRAIAPYRAGSGPSDLDRPMSRAKDADDVFALVDHLGIKKFVISGHCGSLGVVRQIYLSRPERIVGVIAIEGGAFGGRCKLPAKFRNNPKVARQRLDKEMLPLFDKNRQELAPLNRLWDHPSNYNTALLKRWKSKTNRRRRGRAGRSKDPRDLKNPENKFFCKVPLLVIAAGRGRMRLNDPRTIGFRNSMRSKDATFVLITNAGHWVFSERPKPTNKAILAFLARLPSKW